MPSNMEWFKCDQMSVSGNLQTSVENIFCSEIGIWVEIAFVPVNVSKPCDKNMKSDNVRKCKSATCSKMVNSFFKIIFHL